MKQAFESTFRVPFSSLLFIPALLLLMWMELVLITMLVYQFTRDSFINRSQLSLLLPVVMIGFGIWTSYQAFRQNQNRFEQRMNCSIRPILPTDEAFLWEMLYRSLNPATSNQTVISFLRGVGEPPEINHYLENWGRSNDYGVVAIDQSNRQLMGAAWFRLLTGGEKGYGYVSDRTPELVMAVAPKYQDIEIEMRLLIHLLAVAKKRFSSVSFRVSPQKRGWRSYQLLGFRVISKTRTSVVMQKDLHTEQSLSLK